jgi:flagellar biosynthesis protein FliQ
MTIDVASDMFNQGISLLLSLVMPAILSGLGIGLMVSLFQAVTQIQEQTLTFVPKMVMVMVVLSLTFPWMASRLVTWITALWSAIPTY